MRRRRCPVSSPPEKPGSPTGIQTRASVVGHHRPERLPPVRAVHVPMPSGRVRHVAARRRCSAHHRLAARRRRGAAGPERGGRAGRQTARASRRGPSTRASTGPRHARPRHADLRHHHVRLRHGGREEDAVDPAMASDPTAFFYSRTGNPRPRARGEDRLPRGRGDSVEVAASGIASVAATLLANLASGDHLVVGDKLFAITRVLMDDDLHGTGSRSVPWHDQTLAAVEAAITRRRSCCCLELLDDPRLRIADLDTISALALAAGPRWSRQHRSSGRPCCAPRRAEASSCSTPRAKSSRAARRRVSGVVSGSADRSPRSGGTASRSARRRPILDFLVLRGVRSACPSGRPPAPRTPRPSRRSSRPIRGSSGSRYPRLASHPDQAVATHLLGDQLRGDGDVQAPRWRRRDVGLHRPPAAVRHRRRLGDMSTAGVPAAEARRPGARLGGLRASPT